MKFIVDIEAEIQSGFIQEFASIMFQDGFSVNSFHLISRDDYNEMYSINLIYSDSDRYAKAVSLIEGDPRCISFKSTNILENEIKNGLLKTTSRLSFENEDEFQTNHTGAYQLLKDKILSESPDNSFYFHDSVCSISGVKPVNGIVDKRKTEVLFLQNEKDSSIISRFTNVNSFPIVVSYSYPEDFLKILQNLQYSFSFYRIHEIDDEDDPDVYMEILVQSELPVITYKTVELPILYLHAILHAMQRYKLKNENTNIGMIGLDSSANYTTAIINSLGFMKVLGYDENEKSMMLFESKKGLATTKKNILENCDIIFLVRDHLGEEDIVHIRPGIIIISFITTEVTENLKKHKSCKMFLDISKYDTAVFLPGIVKGLLSTQLSEIDLDLIIRIAEYLQKKDNQLRITPQLFSSIHDDIEDIIVSHSMR
jgi:hypothetical protein